MELKELVEETMNIFQVQGTENLGIAVFEAIRNEETEKYDSFCNMTNDLSKDWMQMIFQYYQADRKEKKTRLHTEVAGTTYGEVIRKYRSCTRFVCRERSTYHSKMVYGPKNKI